MLFELRPSELVLLLLRQLAPELHELLVREGMLRIAEVLLDLNDRVELLVVVLLQIFTSQLLSTNFHLIEIGLERLSRIDLVAAFRIQDPISDKRLGLSRVLRIVNSYMDELFTRRNFCFVGYRSFVDVTDLTKAPSGNIDKVLLSNLDSINIQRFTHVFICDRRVLHFIRFDYASPQGSNQRRH
jgi:hypothetical protein